MKIGWGLAAGALALAMSATAGNAADKHVNLKLSYWVPPTQPLTQGYKDWAKAVETASHGTISVTLYPSSQLGSGKDEYDLVKRGIADFGLVAPGYSPGRFPVAAALDLPFMVGNGLKAAPALDRWYRQYAAKEMPEVHLCHVFTAEPGTFHSTKPIRVPSDLKGLNIRTANQTTSTLVSNAGGNPVQVSIMEAYDTLKRGIADGITSNWEALSTFRFGQVTKYSTDLKLFVASFVDVINQKFYDSLSPMQRQAIDSACTPEWSAKVYHYWADEQFELQDAVFKAGKRDILKETPADLKLWHDAAKPLDAAWAAGVTKSGRDPKKVMASLKDALAKAGGGL